MAAAGGHWTKGYFKAASGSATVARPVMAASQPNGLYHQAITPAAPAHLSQAQLSAHQAAATAEAGKIKLSGPFKNLADADQKLTATYSQKPYTASELKAAFDYKAAGFDDINGYLHAGASFKGDVERAKRAIPGLDAAMQKSSVPANLTAYRVQPPTHPLYGIVDGLKKGGTFTSKGYDSTTINPNLEMGGHAIDRPNGGVVLEIRVKRGQKGFYFGGDTKSWGNSYQGAGREMQTELLLARNTTYKLVSKTKGPDGSIHAVVEVVKQ